MIMARLLRDVSEKAASVPRVRLIDTCQAGGWIHLCDIDNAAAGWLVFSLIRRMKLMVNIIG